MMTVQEVFIGDEDVEGQIRVSIDLQDHRLPVGIAAEDDWSTWLTRADVKRLRKVLKRALEDTEESS